jgi:hypothetical protein
MTDKQLIKQEIERVYRHYLCAQEFDSGYNMALDDILRFIDSLPEEPASKDLEEEIKSWIPAHIKGGGEYMRKVAIEWSEIVARHFAEWQKQKDLQDFLEKAEMYLKTRVYYNMHPNNVITAIQDFKNYMQNESEN